MVVYAAAAFSHGTGLAAAGRRGSDSTAGEATALGYPYRMPAPPLIAPQRTALAWLLAFSGGFSAISAVDHRTEFWELPAALGVSVFAAPISVGCSPHRMARVLPADVRPGCEVMPLCERLIGQGEATAVSCRALSPIQDASPHLEVGDACRASAEAAVNVSGELRALAGHAPGC